MHFISVIVHSGGRGVMNIAKWASFGINKIRELNSLMKCAWILAGEYLGMVSRLLGLVCLIAEANMNRSHEQRNNYDCYCIPTCPLLYTLCPIKFNKRHQWAIVIKSLSDE